MRLKSTSVGFSGKRATPIKRGEKRPIVSSSCLNSPEENRPIKPPTQRTRITAKTVSIPVRSRSPILLSSSTPLRANSSSRKSVEDTILDAPGIRPIIRDTTPIVDLTASSSTSGNLLPVAPISIKTQAPSPSNSSLITCTDLIPISSDDDSSVPKSQECSAGSNSAVPGPSRRDTSASG